MVAKSYVNFKEIALILNVGSLKLDSFWMNFVGRDERGVRLFSLLLIPLNNIVK